MNVGIVFLQLLWLAIAGGLVVLHGRRVSRQIDKAFDPFHRTAWVLAFLMPPFIFAVLPGIDGARRLEQRLGAIEKASPSEQPDDTLARARLFVQALRLQLPKQGPLAVGFGSSAGFRLPSSYNLPAAESGGILFFLRGDQGDGRLLLEPGPALGNGSRIIFAQAPSSTKDAGSTLPAFPDEKKIFAGKECDPDLPLLSPSKETEVDPGWVFVYLFECKARRVQRVASFAFDRPNLADPLVRAFPRRWDNDRNRWRQHQVELTRASFVQLGGLSDSVLPAATLVEIPAPQGASALLLPPKRILDCRQWLDLNKAESTGLVRIPGGTFRGVENDVTDGTQCTLEVGPFLIELRMLRPENAFIRWRALWALFLLAAPSMLALWGARQARKTHRPAAMALQGEGIALGGMILSAILQWRLLWAHRLDFLHPPGFAVEGDQIWLNTGLAAGASALLVAALVPFWLRLARPGPQADRTKWLLWGFAPPVVWACVTMAPLLWQIHSRKEQEFPIRVVGSAFVPLLAVPLFHWGTDLLPTLAGWIRSLRSSRLSAAAAALFVGPMFLSGSAGLPWSYLCIALLCGAIYWALRSLLRGDAAKEVWFRILLCCFLGLAIRGRTPWSPDLGMITTYGGLALLGATVAASLEHIGRLGGAAMRARAVLAVCAAAVVVAGAVVFCVAAHREEPFVAAHLVSSVLPFTIVLLAAAPLIAALTGQRTRRWPPVFWVPLLLAGVLTLTAFASLPKLAASNKTGAQRIALIFEPWNAHLVSPTQMAKSLAVWRDLRIAPDLLDTGQGYFGSDIFDRGTVASLESDYFSILLLRDAGRCGLLVSVFLIWLAVGAAWSGLAGGHDGSAAIGPRFALAFILAGLALYQPLSVMGLLPFTGVPMPGLGINSWADFWLVSLLLASSLMVAPSEQGRTTAKAQPSQRTSRVATATGVCGAGAAALAAVALWTTAGLAVTRSAGLAGQPAGTIRPDPFKGVGSLGLDEMARVADAFRGNARALFGTRDKELAFGALVPQLPATDAAQLSSFLVDWKKNYERTQAWAESIVGSGCKRPEPGKRLPEWVFAKLPSTAKFVADRVPSGFYRTTGPDFWTFKARKEPEGTVCEARFNFGWFAYAIEVSLPARRIKDGYLDLTTPVADYVSMNQASSPQRPRYRLVSRPDGVAASDLAEITATDLVVRLRPGAGELRDVDADGQRLTGYQVASRLRIGDFAELRVGFENGKPVPELAPLASSGGHPPKVLEYVPGGVRTVTRNETGDGWSAHRLDRQDVVKRLSVIIPPDSANNGRGQWIVRPATSIDQPAIVLADDARVYPSGAHRLYPFGGAMPELGWRGPKPAFSYGLDGWVDALLRRNDLTTPAISAMHASFVAENCGSERRPATQPKTSSGASEQRSAPGDGTAALVDAMCPPSPLDNVPECRVTLQPELNVHLRHLLELTARRPSDFAHLKKPGEHFFPARKASAVLLRADSGEIAAQGTFVAGRESTAFAPRTFDGRAGLLWSLDAGREHSNLMKVLADGGPQPKDGCGKKAGDELSACLLAPLYECDGRDCRLLAGQRDWARHIVDRLCSTHGMCGLDVDRFPAAIFAKTSDDERRRLARKAYDFDDHAGAVSAPWTEPIAIGSTLKPFVARAASKIDRAALESLTIKWGQSLPANGDKTRCKSGYVYGHCTPTSVYDDKQDSANASSYLTKSLNWYQAPLGFLLPAFGGGSFGPVNGQFERLGASTTHDLSTPATSFRSTPLDVTSADGRTAVDGKALDLDVLRESQAWRSLENVLGRPACALADADECRKLYASRDLCAAREVPIPVTEPSLRRLVATGDSEFPIAAYALGSSGHRALLEEYFNFLRGAGVRPMATTLQLAESYMRLLFHRRGDLSRVTASTWFPANFDDGVQEVSPADCARPDTLDAVDRGLCGVLAPGGTAEGAFAKPVPHVTLHGAKTGTVDSLIEIRRNREGKCEKDARVHTRPDNEASRDEYALCQRRGKPSETVNDSLFVVGFTIRTGNKNIPMVLALSYQGVGYKGFAPQVARRFVEMASDYYAPAGIELSRNGR